MTGTSLKLAMMILMVFDHIGAFIPAGLSAVFHLLTRPVAPVFAFMAIEGFIYSKNREKYLVRLYSWSFIMAGGNILVNRFIIRNPVYFVNNNIFFTLALGVSLLYVYENFTRGGRKVLGSFLSLIIFLSGSFFSEGGIFILPFMLIGYIFRDNRLKRDFIYLFITLVLASMTFVKYDSWWESFRMLALNSDFLIFIAGLPFIYLYNGQKGGGARNLKYLFYIFYPVHLWLLGILAAKLA